MGISTENKYDAIIIGAGLGGLSCGLHMAKRGFNILVLEKQPKVGGYCQNYIRGEYEFDVSLHLLSAMNKKGGLYRLLDYLQVLDKLKIEKHDPMFTCEFPGTTYQMPGGEGPAGEYLKSKFPGEKEGIDKFIDISQRLVGENGDLFWHGHADYNNFFPSRYFKKTYSQLLDECFTDKRLHGLLGQLWQSTGLPNSLCAANWAVEVLGSHLLSGNYYIHGGGQHLSSAMAQTLREAGSVVKTSALVNKVLIKDRRAYGVALENGEEFFAPVIVSNANPVQTYFSLIGKEQLSEPYIYKLGSMEKSCSLLTLYLGLDCPGSVAGLETHTLFSNASYDNLKAYNYSMAGDYQKSDYLISDYTETGSEMKNHPVGSGIAQILEVADGKQWTDISRDEYEEKKKRTIDTILKKVSTRFPDLQKHICVCEMGTPRTMKLATRNPDGCVYGWAQTPGQADNSRFGVSSIFQGMYFTGAWCRGGGGGYMGAIVNGRVASMQIMAREDMPGHETQIPIVKSFESNINEYNTQIKGTDISPLGEISQQACVRIFGEAADNYIKDAISHDTITTFFQMRFVFVPYVKVKAGNGIRIDIKFTSKEKGKGEFTLNMFLKKSNQKLANCGGRVLIR